MKSLRSQMIRLAYSTPELRGDLLPLLRRNAAKPDSYWDYLRAATDQFCQEVLQAIAKGLGVRDTPGSGLGSASEMVWELYFDLEGKSFRVSISAYKFDVVNLRVRVGRDHVYSTQIGMYHAFSPYSVEAVEAVQKVLAEHKT